MDFVVNDPLQTSLADIAELLHREGIGYALVGGLAASLRGQTRATADIDVIIGINVDRAVAFASGLEGTKFRPLFDDVTEVVERSFILPLRHRLSNVKVDLALGLSGFEQQALARAQPMEIFGTLVPVVTAEDLLVMKILAGRPQDEQDARGIVTVQKDRLDWDYCLKVAGELGEALGQNLVAPMIALRSGLGGDDE
jgi:hypothetical protein